MNTTSQPAARNGKRTIERVITGTDEHYEPPEETTDHECSSDFCE